MHNHFLQCEIFLSRTISVYEENKVEEIRSGFRPISIHKESDIDYCGVTDYSAYYQPVGNHLCKGQAQKQMQGQRNCILITMPDFTYYVSKTQKCSTNTPHYRNIHIYIILPLMMMLI